MKHNMGLQNRWFDKIESGEKRYELRLFDAKRQQIRLGDTIEFASKDGRKITKEVKSLSIFPDFLELFTTMGDETYFMLPGLADDEIGTKLMEEFYPLEMQHVNGVVAIGLK